VADPGFLCRIPDLIFTYPLTGSLIQKQQQKRVVKNNYVVITFYVASNFIKFQIIFVLQCCRTNLETILKDL